MPHGPLPPTPSHKGRGSSLFLVRRAAPKQSPAWRADPGSSGRRWLPRVKPEDCCAPDKKQPVVPASQRHGGRRPAIHDLPGRTRHSRGWRAFARHDVGGRVGQPAGGQLAMTMGRAGNGNVPRQPTKEAYMQMTAAVLRAQGKPRPYATSHPMTIERSSSIRPGPARCCTRSSAPGCAIPISPPSRICGRASCPPSRAMRRPASSRKSARRAPA